MPTLANYKGLHPGISVWIFDDEHKLIRGVDIVEELQDGFWKCACLIYSQSVSVDPYLKFFVRHADDIFRTRDEILDKYAAEARNNLSRRSYEHQIKQEEHKEAYEAEWSKHYARCEEDSDNG